MPIVTYTPREVETRVVQEERITLNLTINQAKVVFGALSRTNGIHALPVWEELSKMFSTLEIEVPTFIAMDGKRVVLNANAHGL